MRRIIFRRGLETNTPLLAVGEPGFSTDTGKLYIGSPTGNILINTISGSGGLTEQQLDDAIEAALAGYATESYVNNQINMIPPPNLTGYATETYVNDAIGDIESPVSVDSNNNITLTTEDTFIDDNEEEITVTKQWEFASDGATYLSKNSFESTTYLSTPLNETDVSLEITAGRDIYLKTAGYDSEGGVSTSIAFKFDDEGAITFPNGTVQTSANILWSISASGSSSYTFSGPGIVSGNTNNPVLHLQRGSTYTFVNTTGTNHPFAIRVSNGGAAYTSGVSGSQTGTQTFTVPMDAPSTLYYQCTIHSAMGNTINIIDAKDTYGCFHKLASLTAPAADTVYNFDWYTDTTVHESEGVTVTSSNPTRISIAKSGKYSVFTEMIVRINGSSERNVFLWLAKNGTDIPETGVKVSLKQGGGINPVFQTLAKQWLLDDINADDYIELRYALNRVDDIQLEYTPAQTEPYIRPAIPSATITIIEV
jgi:hypothetical protein